MAKDTIFRIFSMSKPVAGIAIMMLLEQGKVRLNDPVSKFIPELKGVKVAVPEERPAGTPAAEPPRYYMIPASREITIQDLLTHVSGFGQRSGERRRDQEADGGSRERYTRRLDPQICRHTAGFPARVPLEL